MLPWLWSSLWLCPGVGEVGPRQEEDGESRDGGGPRPPPGPGPLVWWLLGGAPGTALVRGNCSQLGSSHQVQEAQTLP